MSETTWPIGARVLYDGDDPTDDHHIGTVVEPTAEDVAKGDKEQCGFDLDDNPYVCVEWHSNDPADNGTYRDWAPVEDLVAASS
jgi:hypothetical protein